MKESYKIRSIRISDKTWELFKKERWKSQKSWNIFIYELIKKNEQKFKNKQQ